MRGFVVRGFFVSLSLSRLSSLHSSKEGGLLSSFQRCTKERGAFLVVCPALSLSIFFLKI